jgi:beta-phosphoglucomutase family hydrolase
MARPMTLGALFDWDGVIIDSSAQHEASWRQLANEIGRPLPDGFFARAFGMKNDRIIPDILGWTRDSRELDRLSERKEALYREVIRREGIRPLAGVEALLRRLADHAVPCAVASSTSRANIETIFDMIGLRGTFAAVVSAEDVRRGKPDPEVFLTGARAIGRPADRCVVFEDAHVGIEAGLAAGCKVIAVATTHPVADLGRAHRAVASLEEVDWPVLRELFIGA